MDAICRAVYSQIMKLPGCNPVAASRCFEGSAGGDREGYLLTKQGIAHLHLHLLLVQVQMSGKKRPRNDISRGIYQLAAEHVEIIIQPEADRLCSIFRMKNRAPGKWITSENRPNKGSPLCLQNQQGAIWL